MSFAGTKIDGALRSQKWVAAAASSAARTLARLAAGPL